MKEIKLNQDGSLNILNPEKIFVLRLRDNRKLYLIDKHANSEYYAYVGICRDRSNYHTTFRSVQEIVTSQIVHYGHRDKVFQFESMEDFIQCMKEGKI